MITPQRFIPLIWTSATGAIWAEQNSGISPHFQFLIFNLSVFELVGFQQKYILNLLIMLYHPAKVPSMFFTISLDLRSAHCESLEIMGKNHQNQWNLWILIIFTHNFKWLLAGIRVVKIKKLIFQKIQNFPKDSESAQKSCKKIIL